MESMHNDCKYSQYIVKNVLDERVKCNCKKYQLHPLLYNTNINDDAGDDKNKIIAIMVGTSVITFAMYIACIFLRPLRK